MSTTKKTFYKDVNPNPDFSKLESDIQTWWDRESVFKASIDQRNTVNENGSSNAFVFYDGPPFANGLPHYGHLLTGFVKDVFARYETIKGKKVDRKFGWDCHGLPAEMGAEKELGISGRIEITDFGINKFNDHCRSSVMKYANEWQSYVNRQGRWVDFDGGYKTMDTDYMESVLWAFKQLSDKGLLYESQRVMPYSWACETPLSNFETRMDNSYREKKSKAVTVAFELKDKPNGAPDGCEAYKVLAWTTTPWTLPSNLSLAVGKDIGYSCVIKENVCYILADSSLANYAKELDADSDATYLRLKGSELEGLTYNPLFPFFADTKDAFKILAADFVEEGDGTGIVHLAPGFGEDDQAACEAAGIPVICPVDVAGKFNEEVSNLEYDLKGTQTTLELVGKQVFDTNDDIIKYLKGHNAWLRTEQYIHNYPHCWRTDTPLIYKAVPSWYVKVTDFKDRMVKLNQQINWVPDHIKDGLFGKWLENARDWSITRNRFWGCPVPVWKSSNPNNKEIKVFGSIAELEAFFTKEEIQAAYGADTITDLHRPYIDGLKHTDENGETWERVSDVLDCWFESGSMPFAQAHYPFENKEWFEKHFPADFIVEYQAQTRGWFYTLMVLSTALFDRPPFKNCICHGVVLAEDGQKLSKRLKNYPDPWDIFNSYGADALRWFMMSSSIMRGGDLQIDKKGDMIRDTLRLVIKPLWNAYNFFVLYANSDGIEAKYSINSTNVMDRYILAKLKDAVLAIRTSLDQFNTPDACAAAEEFCDVLNNWYIRRSRPRFWKSDYDEDKQAAYDTLYTVLDTLSRAVSPLLPMVSEEIYQGINPKQAA